MSRNTRKVAVSELISLTRLVALLRPFRIELCGAVVAMVFDAALTSADAR